jgi:hypothetical protein
MAPPRTFDYETLRRLVREHPDWSYHMYARGLTLEARKRDSKAPWVKSSAIQNVISRYRDEWNDQGDLIRFRNTRYPELLPELGRIAVDYRNHVILRRLRTLARLNRGEPVYDTSVAAQALRWEAQRRERHEVVDISARGKPFLRAAEPWELDDQGELVALVAWLIQPPDPHLEQKPERETPRRRPASAGRP